MADDPDSGIHRVLNFVNEATQNLAEVSYAVLESSLSSFLPCDIECAYFNLTTREGERFCVRLSRRGFEVVGHEYDSVELEGGSLTAFETIYSLLDYLSPSYRSTFHGAVTDKLNQLESSPEPTGPLPLSTDPSPQS